MGQDVKDLHFRYAICLCVVKALLRDDSGCYHDKNNETCCAGYERVGGKCTPCPNGRMSVAGEYCKKCQEGFYGNRCSKECKCCQHERCDIVVGCMPVYKVTEIVTICVLSFVVVVCAFIHLLKRPCRKMTPTEEHSEMTSTEVNETKFADIISDNNYQEIHEDDIREDYIITFPQQRPEHNAKGDHIAKKGSIYSRKTKNKSSRTTPYKPTLTEQENCHDYIKTSRDQQDDYLNPHLSILERNIEVYGHEYESIENGMKEDYLNPYQPILEKNIVVHEYDESTGKERKDNNLNPFQPVLKELIEVCRYQTTSNASTDSIPNRLQTNLRKNIDDRTC